LLPVVNFLSPPEKHSGARGSDTDVIFDEVDAGIGKTATIVGEKPRHIAAHIRFFV
jgi:DNA repair ATPase RecN